MAKGVVIDEAEAMDRSYAYCVWGNTLRPCLLGGDLKQLRPVVASSEDKDEHGNYFNRCGSSGQISILEFFLANGFPAYRMHVQLRMGNGLFDIVHKLLYPEFPATYGLGCNITLPQHTIGCKLEGYMAKRFPELKRPEAGKLSPIFVNCQDTFCMIDAMTGSKKNPGQARIAVDLLADLVRSTGIDPADIICITPYKLNVGCIQAMVRKYPELARMPEIRTVDSFQGREKGIVVVVMATTRRSGPGFTTDENRLAVLTTRQRSGLLILGDIDVTGKLGKGGGAVAKAEQDAKKRFLVVGEDGEVHFAKATILRGYMGALLAAGRVVHVKDAKDKGAEDAKAEDAEDVKDGKDIKGGSST